MFSAIGTVAVTSTGSFSAAQAERRGDHGGRAAHVGLHPVHVRGLEVQAAGVEGDALADQRDLPPPGPDGDDAAPGAVDAPIPADAEDRTELPRLSARSSSTSTARPCSPATSARVGERLRVEVVGWGVDEVAHKRDASVTTRRAQPAAAPVGATAIVNVRSAVGVGCDLYSVNRYAPSTAPSASAPDRAVDREVHRGGR